jgi:hypothetical protein
MELYENSVTTWHYIGEDLKRALHFDPRRKQPRKTLAQLRAS